MRILDQLLTNIGLDHVERIHLRRSPLPRCPLTREVSSNRLAVSSQMPGKWPRSTIPVSSKRVLPHTSPAPTSTDGDRVIRSQLTWISGATAGLLWWWILSYSIGVRMPRAVWRPSRLWKISTYSKIALANSMRVRHRLRSRSSTCIRAQNDSINALSKQSPTDTDGGNETGLLGPVCERPGREGRALV